MPNSIVSCLTRKVFFCLSISSMSSKLPEDNSLEINTSKSLAKSIIDVNPVFTASATENSGINPAVSKNYVKNTL